MTILTLPAVERPNGKLYRPRKLRYANWDIDLAEDSLNAGEYIAVLGTHDVEVALEFIRRQVPHSPLVDARKIWLWLACRDGELAWINDDVSGAAAVQFRYDDDYIEAIQ